MSKYTITRRKVKADRPVAIGKRDFYYNYYVNSVFAGRTIPQVHEYISRFRLDLGYSDTPPLTAVKEAFEMAAFTDCTILKKDHAWVVSID